MTEPGNPARTMMGNPLDQFQDRLILRGRLSDIQQVSPWIEDLALRFSISANIRYSMILCLEEVISNIIQYGYRETESGSILVHFKRLNGCFELVVFDDAPLFNPLDAPEIPALNPHEEMRLGGHGIRLLRRFADEIEYEAAPEGNRLLIRFMITDPAAGSANSGRE